MPNDIIERAKRINGLGDSYLSNRGNLLKKPFSVYIAHCLNYIYLF
jgi:hypothetical protein